MTEAAADEDEIVGVPPRSGYAVVQGCGLAWPSTCETTIPVLFMPPPATMSVTRAPA